MKITILVDNNTLTDRYFFAEPGLSLLLEHEGQRTLLDAGYSDIFLRNAAKMGQDLLRLDRLVLSHGHLDHSWGLTHLIAMRTEARIEGLLPPNCSNPELVAHPLAFEHKPFGPLPEIGSLLDFTHLQRHFALRLSREPLWLSGRLLFLGEIPRRFDFEDVPPMDGDILADDSSLVWRDDNGLVLLTGCAHAGVCNTLAHAMEICGERRVLDVIGGLHLQNAPASRLQGTAAYLEKLGLKRLHACHCTDLAAKIHLARTLPLREVGVGLTIAYPPSAD